METMLNHLRTLWASVALTPEQVSQVLSVRQHSPYLRRHRADVIIVRVQFVSAVFAVLTPLWVAIDSLAFPTAVWELFAMMRLVAAAIFLALALPWDVEKNASTAFFMLTVMLLSPPLFYVISQPMFSGVELSAAGKVVAELYGLLPFVVLAGLGIFPLTALETMAYALPVFLLTGWGLFESGAYDLARTVGTLWLLFLIFGVAALSGMVQLHYMISLVRRAAQDPLTGVFTRRSGCEIINLQFRIAIRQDLPFSIAYFDIDDFKSINDTYGHEAGDKVLRETAIRLRGLLRQSDALVRWGGEEFLAILSNTDCAGARLVIERIMKEWLGTRPDGGPVTTSIGVAERIHDDASDWPAMVELADHRMYEAKQRGKRRCFTCDDVEIV